MRAALILFCVLPLLAQEQVPTKTAADKAAPASIAGLVVRADTGEPLKKATLALSSDDAETRYESRTNPEGRFQIANVPPGRYSLWASCPGYVGSNYGGKSAGRQAPVLVLEKGQQLRDVLIRLQRTAAVAGRVLDESGEPVQDAKVSVLFYYGRGEKRQLAERQSAQTNDLGEYRIFGLDPGKYYLRATPSQESIGPWSISQMPERTRDPSEQAEQEFVYPPIFYQAATDVSQASRIELKPGDEFRADFAFAAVPAFKIRGHVLGTILKSGDPVAVILTPKGMVRGDEQQAARIAKDASYEIADVLPGSYRLSVSAAADFYNPTLQTTIKRTVEVTNSDLDNVDLMVRPASKIEVRGRVTVEGDAPSSFEHFNVGLVPIGNDDDDFGIWKNAQVNADGTFLLRQVSAGNYFIEAGGRLGPGRGYYLKSGRFGTRDVTESALTVTEGTQPRLELVLSSSTARIEGVVEGDKELPIPGARVVAVPRGSAQISRFRNRVTTTDKNGFFVLPNVRPGEYKLLAFDNADYSDFSDAEFMKQHDSASVTTQAQAGSTAKVKLKLISLDEDSQQDNE